MSQPITTAALALALLAPGASLRAQGGAPANDLCTGATVVALSPGVQETRTGNSAGSTDEVGFGAAQVWEAFSIAQCMDVTVDLCGTSPAFGNTFINLVIGCPINNIVNTGIFDLTSCGDNNATLSFVNLAPGTYYFPVINEPGSSGAYTVHFLGQPCATPPPANDDCPGATVLTPNAVCTPVTSTTEGASGSLPGISCSGMTGDANDDVWFSFMATAASHTIVVEPAPNMNPVIDLRDGTCASSTSLSCADAGLLGATESLTVGGLTVGTTYYVRVYDWYGGQASTPGFTICVTGGGSGPVNDLCGNVTASPLAVGGTLTFTGTTVGATTTADASVVSPLNDGVAKVWHAFTLAQCADVSVTYCGTAAPFDEVYLALSASCPADQPLFTTQSAYNCVDNNAQISFLGVPAGTYYLPVGRFGPGSTGPYNITVSAAACVAAPDNDACANATYFSVVPLAGCPSGAVTGYTTTATASGADPSCSSSTADVLDVWYIFEPGGNSQVEVTLNPVTASSWGVAVYEGCGGTEVACVPGPTGPITVPTTPNMPHYVRVFSNTQYGLGGTFDLCIGADIATVTNGPGGPIPFAVFPDPATGQADLRWNGPATAVRLSLVDLTGRVLRTERRTMMPGTGNTIELGGLAPGGYVVRCEAAEGSWQRRLTVQ